MRKLILSMTLWSAMAAAINSPELTQLHRFTEPLVVRVYGADSTQLQWLVDTQDVWTKRSDHKYATVYVPDAGALHQILNQGLTVRIDQAHMRQLQIAKDRLNQPNFGGGDSIPGFACYSTVEHTFERMDQMVLDHPTLASIEDIGDTWEKINAAPAGFDLRVLKLTNQNTPGDKPVLFLASAIHAREYTTAELNTRFAEYLLDQYGTNPDVTWILDHHEIHLSLQTNPDGRKEAETGILWRKNKNNNHCPDSNNRGVDLNRNYPFIWDPLDTACGTTFSGPSAGSEPEVMAQMDYLRSIYEDNRGTGNNDAAPADTPGIFVDIHSFSELVLWPWGFSSNDTANNNQLRALGKRTAFFTGYRPQPVNELVVTPGGSIDTTYGELGVASLAFELGTSFFQDCATFENDIFPDNLQSLLYLARVTQAPYIQPLGPDITDMTLVPNVIAAGDAVQISGQANDDQYNQSNGSQTVDNVAAVALTIDELPINAVSSQALAASDGGFDNSEEAFAGSFDSTGLTTGRHMVYVQATDSAGHPGGTFAQFIDVVDTNNVAQLSGQVLDASNGLPVPGALLSINQSNALADNQGQYSQWVQPGTANLTISADNYLSQTIDDLTLNAGSNTEQDILLQPFCQLFFDDVETSNPNWTAEAPWASVTGQAFSGVRSWHDSPGGEYANGVDTSLTSPTIDVSATTGIQVSYMSFCDTEATYDFGIFEVQFDGGAWQELNRCDGSSSWEAVVEPISVPNGAADFNFRFRLDTDNFVTQDGWYVDDIEVRGSGAVCGTFDSDLIFADGFQ